MKQQYKNSSNSNPIDIWYIYANEVYQRVALKDVLYFHSEKQAQYLHTTKQLLKINVSSLDSVEMQLHECAFARIHSDYLVNMKHVHCFNFEDSCMYLRNGNVLPVDRKYSNRLLSKVFLFKSKAQLAK
ncbi:MAG: LytTR family DNA-binding domain-containing protein [Bacteroidota bacterium]